MSEVALKSVFARLSSGETGQISRCDVADVARLNASRLDLGSNDLGGESLEARLEAWAERGFVRVVPGAPKAHAEAVRKLAMDLSGRCRGPVLIEGINPPWILSGLMRVPSPGSAPFFKQRYLILQRDWDEFFDGLSYHDLGDEIGDARYRWFVGEDAPERLVAWCSERITDAPISEIVQNRGLGRPASPGAEGVRQRVLSLWGDEESRLRRQIRARTDRGLAWWAERFRDRGLAGEPLRVLLPVSRYTTYLRHIATDMRLAFRSLGVECRVFSERDESSVWSQCSIMDEIVRYDPHLIISINFTRNLLASPIPADIPHVCWIQDAMEQLFSSEVGAGVGKRDFVVGMVHAEMVKEFGYPAERTKWLPMVASRSKFEADVLTSGFEAEIAWVTHQSESVDAMRARVLREFRSTAPHMVAVFETLFDRIGGAMRELGAQRPNELVRRLTQETLYPQGVPDQARHLLAKVFHNVAYPYAERVYRHQVAEWAGRIAERRGWRFNLYGQGWEKHPTLARFAQGPVEHGDDLRGLYQRTTAQLHASLSQVLHQRVTECVLAGGLPLCRANMGSFNPLIDRLFVDLPSEPVYRTRRSRERPPKVFGIATGATDETRWVADEAKRLGLWDVGGKDGETFISSLQQLESARTRMSDPVTRANAELLGSMTDLLFTSEEQLEGLLTKAVADADWRRKRIGRAKASVPACMTTEGLADELLGMIGDSLAAQSAEAGQA